MSMSSTTNEDKVSLPYGAYTWIAKRLRPQVTPQHVREVAIGTRKSPRVQRAIERFRASLQEARTSERRTNEDAAA